MKIFKKTFCLTFLLFFTLSSISKADNVNSKNEIGIWKMNNERKYLYFKDYYAIYWHNIKDNWNYFGKDGQLVVGWQYIPIKHHINKKINDNITEIGLSKKWHHFDEDGNLTKDGWKFLPIKTVNTNRKYGEPIKEIGVESKWFYFGDRREIVDIGIPKTGWIYYKNNWYFLNPNEEKFGEMQIGWINLGNNWYFLEKSGSMKTDWIYYKNHWYYLSKDGKMKTGWIKQNKNWYYLNENGVMVVGKKKINKKIYYFDNSGRLT